MSLRNLKLLLRSFLLHEAKKLAGPKLNQPSNTDSRGNRRVESIGSIEAERITTRTICLKSLRPASWNWWVSCLVANVISALPWSDWHVGTLIIGRIACYLFTAPARR